MIHTNLLKRNENTWQGETSSFRKVKMVKHQVELALSNVTIKEKCHGNSERFEDKSFLRMMPFIIKRNPEKV